jgi:anti-sigma factor RsiW
MACDAWKAKLGSYVDGELSEAEMRSFDEHLRGCSSCSSDVLARVQMKRAIQAAGKRYTPSADFRRRIEQKIATKPRRSFSLQWAAVVAALALLVAGAVTSGYLRMRSERNHLFSEVADLHVATMASSSPVDVVSTDRHTVKPWFQGRIPFAFNLPEVQNTEFTLIGGRVAYLDQTPGAELIYDLRKHHISVFIFPEAALRGNLPSQPMLPAGQTFSMETWSQSGLRYFVIGDANATDIAALAKLLQGQ